MVALILDELQHLTAHEFSALIMAVHRVHQRQLPLALPPTSSQTCGKPQKPRRRGERHLSAVAVPCILDPSAASRR